MLDRLTAEGKLRGMADGSFEVFSREALLSGSRHGQRAQRGDYLKIDGAGRPYPNQAAWLKKPPPCRR